MNIIIKKTGKDGIERRLIIGEDFIFYSGLAKDFKKPKFEQNILEY